jgi:hypothetical protein
MSPSRGPADLEEHLTVEELRDTWSLLSQEDRVLAFKMVPYEEAEDFFLSLSARPGGARPGAAAGRRRGWTDFAPTTPPTWCRIDAQVPRGAARWLDDATRKSSR